MQQQQQPTSNSYEHILKYTGLFGGIQGLNILVSLLRNKCIAVILGPMGMGLMSLFNSTIMLLSNSTNLGLPMSAVRNISAACENDDKQELQRLVTVVRSWCLITALAGMLITIVLCRALNSWSFSWGDHTLHFVMLSPIVAVTAIVGGETAILKGMHSLRPLALVSLIHMVAALIIAVPAFLLFGSAAIIPVLLLTAGVQLLLTLHYSLRLFPYRLSWRREHLGQGADMIRLGMAFVAAGMFGSGADFLIRTFLNNEASLETVGFFNAGYMMTMVYAGMVFSAMETDYFPRLSAVYRDTAQANEAVNRQIEVALLMLSPLLVAFLVGMPIFLPLLYSGQFAPVVGMTQVTVLAMYFRAIKLPIAYLPLAHGDSKSYMLLEAFYDILVVVLVVVLFRRYGLIGAGVAITITTVVDFLFVGVYTHVKYRYRIHWQVLMYLCVQFSLGIAAYVATLLLHGMGYWAAGIALTLISAAVSVVILRKKTQIQLPRFLAFLHRGRR